MFLLRAYAKRGLRLVGSADTEAVDLRLSTLCRALGSSLELEHWKFENNIKAAIASSDGNFARLCDAAQPLAELVRRPMQALQAVILRSSTSQLSHPLQAVPARTTCVHSRKQPLGAPHAGHSQRPVARPPRSARRVPRVHGRRHHFPDQPRQGAQCAPPPPMICVHNAHNRGSRPELLLFGPESSRAFGALQRWTRKWMWPYTHSCSSLPSGFTTTSRS